jgi:transposase
MGYLWDALCRAYDALGFPQATGHDETFRQLVLARIIEPASKQDSLRVLEEAGVTAPSYPTLNRRLPAWAEQPWRQRLSEACAAHARLGPASLVLYDVSTPYFETDQGDGFREPGFSKERRLEPQITIGLLTGQDLEAMIAQLDARIEAMMQPFHAARDLLVTIPGIGPLSAAAVISEIGPAPRDYFPAAGHLASWAGLCPGNHESAGKRASGKRRHGNTYLQPVLAVIAWAAIRHPGYLKSLPPARHAQRRLPQQNRPGQGHHHRRPRDPRDHLARPGHRQAV